MMTNNKWIPVTVAVALLIAAMATRVQVVASEQASYIFIVNNWTGTVQLCALSGCRTLEDKDR